MFIGIVILITIASIAILSIVNNYYIAFLNNFGDINEYYSSKYAIISTIERGLNTRDTYGDLSGITISGYSYPNINTDGSYDYARIRTGEVSNNGSTMYITGYIGDYYNSSEINIDSTNVSY